MAEQLKVDLFLVHGSGPDDLVIERDVREFSANSEREPVVTHLARRIAQQNSIDITNLKSSIPGGKIRKEDVLAYMPVATHHGTILPLSTMRKTIARRMKESLDVAAQANHQMDVDCTEMQRMRDVFKKRELAITYTDIMLKVLGVCLRTHPIMNSTWTDAGIRLYDDVNIGMAVALDEGLIVPVLRDVDRKSLAEIDVAAKDVISKAKEGKLLQKDLEGAGFTLTNLGMYGIDRFVAIINQPESGILAMGRIVDKPVVVDKTIQIRPMMTISLTYDHRVIDGATAAKFLMTLKDSIESPYLTL